MANYELTNREMIVMNVIWNHPGKELVLSDILDEVNLKENIKLCSQTVSTYLARLVRKGVLEMHRDGKRYWYEPLVEKDEFSKKYFYRLFIWYDESMDPMDITRKLFG